MYELNVRQLPAEFLVKYNLECPQQLLIEPEDQLFTTIISGKIQIKLQVPLMGNTLSRLMTNKYIVY